MMSSVGTFKRAREKWDKLENAVGPGRFIRAPPYAGSYFHHHASSNSSLDLFVRCVCVPCTLQPIVNSLLPGAQHANGCFDVWFFEVREERKTCSTI